MNTDFKPGSPPILLAFASLMLLVIGGPILWLGANAGIDAPAAAWTNVAVWVGGTIFAIAYLLFVLAIMSTFLTFYLRARREQQIKSAN